MYEYSLTMDDEVNSGDQITQATLAYLLTIVSQGQIHLEESEHPWEGTVFREPLLAPLHVYAVHIQSEHIE